MTEYLFVSHPLFHFDFNSLYLSFSVEIKRKSVSEETNRTVNQSINQLVSRSGCQWASR